MRITEILSTNNIKFAAFDLDGTLVDEKGKLIKNVQQGLENIKGRDIILFIVTGRTVDSFLSLNFSDEFLELFNENVFCADGNVIFNSKTKNIKTNIYLEKKLLYFLSKHFKSVSEFVIETKDGYYATSKCALIKHCFLFKMKRNQFKLINQEFSSLNHVAKIRMYPMQELSLDLKYESVKFSCKIRYSRHFNSIILSPKICKAKALLKFICFEYGLEDLHHVIAFGDGENDSTILKESKFGIAMMKSHNLAIENCDLHLSIPISEYLTEDDGND